MWYIQIIRITVLEMSCLLFLMGLRSRYAITLIKAKDIWFWCESAMR